MSVREIPATYRTLDAAGVAAYLAGLPEIAAVLGGAAGDWQVSEVGDGNLNLVFIVRGPKGSLCVKQALPYLRVAGSGWPLTLERLSYEAAYYAAVGPHVGDLIPRIYHYDAGLYCLVMECLQPHIILRRGLIAGRRYPQAARDVGHYIAQASFATSDLAQPFERKLDGVRLFAGNQELQRITVDLVFADPYRASSRNRHTAPQLDEAVRRLRADAVLKLAAARFGHKFLTEAQALVHGDLHSGSVMVTATQTRVIDPEFAFYGPIGFDLGAFLANLLLNWYAQPGHAARPGERADLQQWLLGQVSLFWESFRERFERLWCASAGGDAYPPSLFAAVQEQALLQEARADFVARLFADMLGFAACKMIRRIIGFAHVIDFEWIADEPLRARCEGQALRMASLLLKHPARFTCIQDVVDAVLRMRDAPGP